MSRTRVFVAAAVGMFGALSLGTAPEAEAGGYRHWDRGPVVVYYPRPYEYYGGYRAYYGSPVIRGYYDPYYGRPASPYHPAGIVYRPFYAEPSPVYCRGWGWVYSRCGRYAKWRCLNW